MKRRLFFTPILWAVYWGSCRSDVMRNDHVSTWSDDARAAICAASFSTIVLLAMSAIWDHIVVEAKR